MLELSARGYTVVAAVRSLERGRAAAAAATGAAPDVMELDLSDLASVRAFAAAFRAKYGRCDVLLNNAGVMSPPERRVTRDNFELQLGVNHLGHALLTSLLLDRVAAAPAGRIINVASSAHLFGSINFDNLQSEGFFGYPALGWAAYGQSKLANVLFSAHPPPPHLPPQRPFRRISCGDACPAARAQRTSSTGGYGARCDSPRRAPALLVTRPTPVRARALRRASRTSTATRSTRASSRQSCRAICRRAPHTAARPPRPGRHGMASQCPTGNSLLNPPPRLQISTNFWPLLNTFSFLLTAKQGAAGHIKRAPRRRSAPSLRRRACR